MLDAREFVVFIDVFYINTNNDTFATTFFNETITLVEPIESFDAQSYVFFVFNKQDLHHLSKLCATEFNRLICYICFFFTKF